MAFAAKLLLGVILLVVGVILCGLVFIGSAWMSLPNAPKSSGIKMLGIGVGCVGLGIAFLVMP